MVAKTLIIFSYLNIEKQFYAIALKLLILTKETIQFYNRKDLYKNVAASYDVI